MPKPIPLEYGKYYHIYNRGNNRENIFIEERNYHYFLMLYAQHIEPIADTYAYCLLYNHFHFLVRIKRPEEIEPDNNQTLRVSETLRVSPDDQTLRVSKTLRVSPDDQTLRVSKTPRVSPDDQTLRVSKTLRVSPDDQTLRVSKTLRVASPSQRFGNFFNAYTKAMNKTYNRTGSIFQNPFGRIEVTSEKYFLHLITYIHQNPQKHGLVTHFRTWPFSSYHALLSTKPTRVKRDTVLAWFGGPTGVEATHQQKIIEHPLAPEDFD